MSNRSESWSYEALLRVLPCDATELVRALVDRPNEAVLLFDIGGRMIYANAAYYRGFGFEPGEKMEETGLGRAHPEDVPRILAMVERSVAEGQATIEYRARHRDGRWVWRFASCLVLRDRDGTPVARLYLIRDISKRKATEEALRQSEERLRMFVEQADDVTLLVDAQGKVEWIHGAERYGIDSSVMVGKSARDFFAPEEADRLHEASIDVATSGKSRTEMQKLTFAGKEFWFHNLAYPVRDADGGITHVGWICRNMTELKRAQEALAEGERYFRRLFDESSIGASIVSLDGHHLRVNARLCEMLGYSPEEMRVLGVRGMTHPDDLAASLREIDRLIAGEIPHILMEKRYIRKDGSVMWARLFVRLMRDESGKPLYMVPTLEDITDLHEAQEALRASEARYRAIVEDQTEFICRSRPDGQLLFVNGPLAEFIGLSREAMVKRNVFEFITPEDSERARRELAGLSRENPVYVGEGHARLQDGRVRWLQWINRAILDEGGRVVEIQGVGRDVTDLREAEEALRESEAEHRALIEVTDTGFVVVDVEGRVVDANAEYVRLTGHENLDQIRGRSVIEWTADYEKARNAEAVKRCLAAGRIRGFEVDYVDTKGRITPVEVNGAVVWSGGAAFIHALTRDISERKRVQEYLRASEARYRGIVDDQTEYIVRFDADGMVRFANPAAARAVGVGMAELVGRSYLDFIAPEDREAARARVSALTCDNPVSEASRRMIAAEGERRWVYWVNRAICDAEGRIVEYQAVGRDVTALREAEEALRRSEERYRGIVEDQTEWIARYGLDRRVTFANDALCRRHGLTREQVIGRPFLEFVPPDRREGVEVFVNGLTPERPVAAWEAEGVDADGQVFYHQWVHRAILDAEGKIAEYQAVGRDLSSIKREQMMLIEQSRIETASTMAGGVAHDVNNLMVAVLGNAELLRGEVSDSAESHDMLAAISRSARRASDLAQKLLAFARGGKYRTAAVDLNEVVRETVDLHRTTIPSGVRVDAELSADLGRVEADRTQMSQVVMNLLLNAVEAVGARGRVIVATQAGRPAEEWSASVTLKPGRYVRLDVRDTGAGMSAETVSHIFQPFFSTRGPGRGLGLAAVYGIVKNHGGEVAVSSSPGRGSTFSVFLPVSAPAPVTAGPRSSRSGGSETILIIDDEPSVIDVTRRMLERLGYKVLAAGGAREALKLVEESREEIQLAILDIGMPDMDGEQLYPLLAKARPKMRVIVASGYDLEAMSQGVLKAGARGFVQKPFISEQLAAEIRAALDAE